MASPLSQTATSNTHLEHYLQLLQLLSFDSASEHLFDGTGFGRAVRTSNPPNALKRQGLFADAAYIGPAYHC
jgi:hypothetical protein